MRCSKANQQLQYYIDKQLTLTEIRALETHLETCSSCRAEFFLLEVVEQSLRSIEMVTEPSDLTMHIMQRVAVTPQQQQSSEHFVLLRPSLPEVCSAIVLATVTMLGLMLGVPSIRVKLPIANGHDGISLLFINVMTEFSHVSSDVVMTLFWVVGTMLGVWITLAFIGEDLRTRWFKAMMDRLPVW